MNPADTQGRTVARLCRYPVKGMTAEALEEVTLRPGRAVPNDRRFAFAHGDSGVDPARRGWAPKSQFLMLARNARLAGLAAALEGEVLTLRRDGAVVARGRIDDPAARAALEAAVLHHMDDEVKGAVHLVAASGQPYSDVPAPWLSIINRASLLALEAVAGAPLDPLRFRANLYYEGGQAWEERDWPGREIVVGEVRLRVEEPIERCAATNVDPQTAARDLNLPLVLQRQFGHVEMGVYATVVAGGTVRVGDRLERV